MVTELMACWMPELVTVPIFTGPSHWIAFPGILSQAVNSDFSNATDVADYLVSKSIPFREAYQTVGRVVKLCIKKKILLKDLTIDQWKEINSLIEEDIFERLLPEKVVASRISEGGTGFDRVTEQLQRWRTQLISPNQ